MISGDLGQCNKFYDGMTALLSGCFDAEGYLEVKSASFSKICKLLTDNGLLNQYCEVREYVSSDKRAVNSELLTCRNKLETFENGLKKLKDSLIATFANCPRRLLLPKNDYNYAHMIGVEDLYECHCCTPMQRSIGNYRTQLSRKLISQIEKDLPIEQYPKITVCSIGSGGCFAEMEVHASLLQKGYKVDWIVIEEDFTTPPNSDESVVAFKNLVKFMSKESHVEAYTRYQSLADLNGKIPHVFFLIDVIEHEKEAHSVNFFYEEAKKVQSLGQTCLVAQLNKFRKKYMNFKHFTSTRAIIRKSVNYFAWYRGYMKDLNVKCSVTSSPGNKVPGSAG